MSDKINKISKNFEHKRIGRILAFQSLYAYDIEKRNADELLSFDFEGNYSTDALAYGKVLVKGTLDNIVMIDKLITERLVKWDFNRISLVDKAVLRFSVYELLFEDVPDVIVINEAVEIVKQFGSEDSYKFVNGILDAINKSKKQGVGNTKKD